MRPFLVVLLLFAAPAALQAQYNYTTNADGVSITITGYNGPGGAVTIPTNINGLTVSGIGSNAFLGNSLLTSVSIPGTVTSIGISAFNNCIYMTSVTMAEGVANIAQEAFRYSYILSNATIPGSVTNIGEQAFSFCSLSNVTIPATVTNIAREAFSFGSLANVTVPGNFASPDNFFYSFGYNPLTSITIESGVTSIGAYVFSEIPYPISVTIPGSVTNIGPHAFEKCQYMNNLTLSYGLISIGVEAFYDSSLTNVTFPASVTSIGAQAFYADGPSPSFFFAGNAPTAVSPVFYTNATVYYVPGTTGWSNTYSGCPTVLWNPQIQAGGPGFGLQGNQFGFNITGTSNIPIVVEVCTNLANPVWTPLQSLTLTNGLCYFSEPWETNSSGRFYRISAP